MSMTEDVTSQSNVSEHPHIIAGNSSGPDDCIRVVFSDMEFLPWDNPDNLVSVEVEHIVGRIKNNLLVLLFLIGGPANLINMAVFYKHGLRDRVNLSLFALSVADELYLLMSMLLHGEQLHVQFTTKERFGPIITSLTNKNMIALLGPFNVSAVLSAILATERCVCVFHTLRFQTLLRTRTMASVIVVVSVAIICLYSIVAFRYRIGCVYDPELDVVVRTTVEGKFYKAHKELINVLHSFVFGVGLHCLELIVVTTTTMLTIVKLRQIVTWRSGTSSVISAKEVALTKILVGSSIFFIACMTPVTLIRSSNHFLPEMNSGRRHHNLYLVGLWVTEMFSLINCTFNFFVYYAMGSRFRVTFWSLCGRRPLQPAKP